MNDKNNRLKIFQQEERSTPPHNRLRIGRGFSRWKSTLALYLITTLLSTPILQAYDFSGASQKRKKGDITVALVAFAEKRTPEVEGLIASLGQELRRTSRVHVQDQAKTNDLLQSYLAHVNQVTKRSSQMPALTQAREKLLANDYASAERLLLKAEKDIQERIQKGGSGEGLAQVYVLRAKVQRNRKNEAAIESEYGKLIRLNPAYALDKNLYSGWERSAFEKVKKQVLSENLGSIAVTSDPIGGEVFLNGFYRGISPVLLDHLPQGPYLVEVRTVNHLPFSQKVTLQSGEKATLRGKLSRLSVASDYAHVDPLLKPSFFKNEAEISNLISTLGYHLGADRVVLVADKKNIGTDSAVYRVGDVRLGAVQKLQSVPLSFPLSESGIRLVAAGIQDGATKNILKNPQKYADASVGSIELHEKEKKPFYRKPLFWVLVGAGAGTGAALAVILTGSAGAAAASGVLVNL